MIMNSVVVQPLTRDMEKKRQQSHHISTIQFHNEIFLYIYKKKPNNMPITIREALSHLA